MIREATGRSYRIRGHDSRGKNPARTIRQPVIPMARIKCVQLRIEMTLRSFGEIVPA